MATAFSGAWRQGAYLQPDARATHVADPAHGDTGPDASPAVFTYSTPAMETLEDNVHEYPGMEWIANTTGRVIDTTDLRSHEHDETPRGAAEAGYYGDPITQFSDEKYSGARFEGLPATSVSPVALQRGRNGLDENNPNGFRHGWIEQTFVDRKFPVALARQHDHRPIYPDTAYVTANTPPVGGQYTSPFSQAARAITNIHMRPTARREPPAMYGDLVTDGSPISPAYDTWVVT